MNTSLKLIALGALTSAALIGCSKEASVEEAPAVEDSGMVLEQDASFEAPVATSEEMTEGASLDMSTTEVHEENDY